MYHPSMWHPIDMAAAFRSLRQTPTTISSPNISPEKPSLSGFNAAFSVNTLLNQSPSSSISAAAAAVAHQQQLLSSLFQHYPYAAAAFRPLFNSSNDTSAFLPASKRFKGNTHDENHCETTSSSDESFGKYSDNRCRSSNFDLHNPQCPICQVSLTGQEMITHVQQELDAIQRRQTKSKREHQILQDNNNNNIDQTFKTRYETFLRVRTSRQQRLNAKLQLHHRRSTRIDTRHCPICYQSIPINSDDEYFFTHVQQCSRKREQLAAVTALANHHQRLPTSDDMDVNVVDIDEKSTSVSGHESFNSDERYSPSTHTDRSYSKSPNVVPEIEEQAKCIACV